MGHTVLWLILREWLILGGGWFLAGALYPETLSEGMRVAYPIENLIA